MIFLLSIIAPIHQIILFFISLKFNCFKSPNKLTPPKPNWKKVGGGQPNINIDTNIRTTDIHFKDQMYWYYV